ncbi:MAG: hypothetical protein ACRDKS_00430, partial [Actinomycetota bacterium]
ISTLDALAGRTPAPRPAGRLAGKGLIVVAAGAVAVAYGTFVGENGMLAAGLIAMLGGSLIAIPMVVSWVGRVASRLPKTMRIAARDTARHGRRTGAATAAATIALILPVAVSALSLSEEKFQRQEQWIGDDHLLVRFSPCCPGQAPDPSSPTDFASEIRSAFPRWTIGANEIAQYPADPAHPEQGGRPAYVQGAPEHIEGGGEYVEGLTLYIGGPDLLRALHAEDGIGALQAGKVVAVGKGSIEDGRILLLPISGDSADGGAEVPAVEAGESRFGLQEIPRFVASIETARRLGLEPAGSGYLILRADGAPSEEDILRVKEIATRYSGAYVLSAEDFVTHYGTIRAAATGGAALIA